MIKIKNFTLASKNDRGTFPPCHTHRPPMNITIHYSNTCEEIIHFGKLCGDCITTCETTV